jgi:4-aminobutyrate aminotransferase-like enzyme
LLENKPSYSELIANMENLWAPCLSQDWPNLPVDRAEGVDIYGHDGRRYLDFVAGFGASNVGHNHPRVVAAARAADGSNGARPPRDVRSGEHLTSRVRAWQSDAR